MSFLKSIGRGLTAVATGGISEIGGKNSLSSSLFGGITNPSTGQPYTDQEITTANLFQSLTPEQKKDLLLNNPNIYTPQGSQTYDPLTNSINLNESEFTKSQRLRQEALAAQLSGNLDASNLDSTNQQIQDATFQRGKALLDPTFAQQRRDLAQQLADQGIPLGSEGYNEAFNRLEQSQGKQYTDLSQASIITAEQVRNQRFNEISSLLGNAQVGGTSFGDYNANFSGLDLFGAEQSGLNRTFTAQQNAQNRAATQRAALISSLGTVAGAGAMALSDYRIKENIDLIGHDKGFNLYEFNYKFDPLRRYTGVMAQEVMRSRPDAVLLTEDGLFMVDYSKIGIEMKEVTNEQKY